MIVFVLLQSVGVVEVNIPFVGIHEFDNIEFWDSSFIASLFLVAFIELFAILHPLIPNFIIMNSVRG